MTNLEKVAVAATVACIIKFLVEGVEITFMAHTISLGHTDSMTYSALLAPLWASHAYNTGKSGKAPDVKQD